MATDHHKQDSNKQSSDSMEKLKTTLIILAAGKGTRMQSTLPKIVHPVAGHPMISRVVAAAEQAEFDDIRIVLSPETHLVEQLLESRGVFCFYQAEQKGTADAVKSAQPETAQGTVVIINGDHPLISSEDLKDWVREFQEEHADMAVISAIVKKPGSYGRIVRHKDQICAIVEAKDASAETLKINEINTGIYVYKSECLNEFLPRIQNENMQKEFYLTDMIELCIKAQRKVHVIKGKPHVAYGVNNQHELARATRYVYRRKAKQLMDQGVIIVDPSNTYIEETVSIGPATVIFPNVHLRGQTEISSFCVIEPHCLIMNSRLAQNVQVRAGSHLEECEVHEQACLGPYARIRPQTVVGKDSHIGNFVELKKAIRGEGVKASHLSYLGDTVIGDHTNIGCGTITCNYAVDKKKYQTKIGKNVFVGSDTQFVAPVQIGDDAVIGSGSCITKDVGSGELALTRSPQKNIPGYMEKIKKKLSEKANQIKAN